MKEIIWLWCDCMIEGRITDCCVIFDSIDYRFELLDFD